MRHTGRLLKQPERWLVLIVAESMPVNDRFPLGAHYAPGARWYYLLGERVYVDAVAARLRTQGYTVAVEEATS